MALRLLSSAGTQFMAIRSFPRIAALSCYFFRIIFLQNDSKTNCRLVCNYSGPFLVFDFVAWCDHTSWKFVTIFPSRMKICAPEIVWALVTRLLYSIFEEEVSIMI